MRGRRFQGVVFDANGIAAVGVLGGHEFHGTRQIHGRVKSCDVIVLVRALVILSLSHSPLSLFHPRTRTLSLSFSPSASCFLHWFAFKDKNRSVPPSKTFFSQFFWMFRSHDFVQSPPTSTPSTASTTSPASATSITSSSSPSKASCQPTMRPKNKKNFFEGRDWKLTKSGSSPTYLSKQIFRLLDLNGLGSNPSELTHFLLPLFSLSAVDVGLFFQSISIFLYS